MPGGRLTHQERRDVAEGLSAGLGYAEIARRLARPTSTVSREVARNGGPGGYRADHAQRATGRRARRPRLLPLRDLPAEFGADGRDAALVGGFAEEFATMMVQTGLPRMAARVLAHLFTTDSASLTAAELVARLRVSPASVSKAIGYLAGLDLVRREHETRRRERYVVDDDVWLTAWQTSSKANADWAAAARRGADLFGVGTPAGARLGQMERFFTTLAEDMSGGPTVAAGHDALTVVAALLHVGGPITVARLAAGLNWAAGRVKDALRDIEAHADVLDPIALACTAPDTYTVAAQPNRLTPAQRAALTDRYAPDDADGSAGDGRRGGGEQQ